MKCPRCLNEDTAYFYKGSKGLYCRKCVKFKRILLLENLEAKDYEVDAISASYSLKFELTPFQKRVSLEVLENLNKKIDVLLHCVCGAGKTELVVESIAYYLSRGLKVCYAIARKEVVVELEARFKQMFKNAKVSALYGGHTKSQTGDLIICTTHQLFRYYQTFDLLILDEVDAFPLSGNTTLMNIAINSCKGNIIYSTATINNFLNTYLKKRNYQEVCLNIRPNLKPLSIPKTVFSFSIFNYLCLYLLLKQMKGQCIIFVSSKKMCKQLYEIFRRIFSVTYVYSDLNDRDKNIKEFKEKKYQHIVSTSVLERGITIRDVSVILILDRKDAFETSAIVQMCGRVGRGINSVGEIYGIGSIFSSNLKDAIKQMRKANADALSILR